MNMKKIVITIETENAAFQPEPSSEIGRILKGIPQNLGQLQPGKYGGEEFKLRDINGNTVGSVKAYYSKGKVLPFE